MFIDICFPKGNEKDFACFSDNLKIKNIFFVKDRGSFLSKQAAAFVPKTFEFGKQIEKNGICILCNLDYKRRFNSPMEMNEVYIKELKDKGCVLCISVIYLKENPSYLDKIRFITSVCKKYGVNIIIASCARCPEEMVPKSSLESICRLLGIGADATEKLHEHLTQSF